jgi:hypothetical protein
VSIIRIDKDRIIRKRVSENNYHALRGTYESDSAFLIAEVIKEKYANGKKFWQIYLTGDLTPDGKLAAKAWRPRFNSCGEYHENLGFETLNAAFNSLNANF